MILRYSNILFLITFLKLFNLLLKLSVVNVTTQKLKLNKGLYYNSKSNICRAKKKSIVLLLTNLEIDNNSIFGSSNTFSKCVFY